MEKDYEYPYGDMQVHEALEDLDRRLKALEPKSAKSEPVKKPDAPMTATQIAQAQASPATQAGH